MSSQDTSEEKTLPPSAKKLREARKKGQISHSPQAITAAVTTAAFGYLLIRFVSFFTQLESELLAVPERYNEPFATAAIAALHRMSIDVALAIVPFIGLLVIVAVLSNIVVNGGIATSMDPVLPKMERIDPMAGLKVMVGMRAGVELIHALIKIFAIGVILSTIASGALQALVEIPLCGLRCAPPILKSLLIPLISMSIGLLLLLGAVDISVQRWLFRRDMRMTRSEMKRERKDSEGDPTVRRWLRQIRSSQVRRTGLRNATFLIRSHDTVLALRYEVQDATVPILVAKGSEAQGAVLLEEARLLNLPVVFDASTTTALASQSKIGAMVPQSMFQPVIGCMREVGIL